jgi:dipeptidase E
MKRLLLISNGTNYGRGYLDHALNAIDTFLQGTKGEVVFVPYARHDWDEYHDKVRGILGRIGASTDSVHRISKEAERISAIQNARAIFVGGGNTFRLLETLYRLNLIPVIREAVLAGVPYIGVSAGVNLACPTIKTTNDMPIVYPPSFDALNLVPININPHYLDPDSTSRHMGETRAKRIEEFHEINAIPVVGLREGAMVRIEGTAVTLAGENGARLFRPNASPEEYHPGARLDLLV